MTQFIDRRLNDKNKSAVNRQRFIRRFKNQIKRAVSDAIAHRHITDIENGEKIIIPAKDITEPTIHHGPGGVIKTVYAGNTDFLTGDRIKRPPQSEQAEGSQATNTGEGQDNFVFEISKDEFLNLFFEDLELPELVKKQINQTPNYKLVRAGFTSTGSPNNLSIIRSFKGAISRRIAMTSTYRQQIQILEQQIDELLADKGEEDFSIKELSLEVEHLKARIKTVPYLEEFDLRYKHRTKQALPSSQAVMFCLMDVSGSMDEVKKDIAKRFFIILYLFLSRNYEKINMVFIRHHTTAKEVDEKEFFYSRETGGTVVSSALELMNKIIQERYPTSSWNIYGAEASDGDNWNADSPYCKELLISQIMPNLQYFAYVEIKPRQHQSLWESYLIVKEKFPNFAMKNIEEYAEIYPVFHELFKRQHL